MVLTSACSQERSFELGLPSPIGADGRLDPNAVTALAERAGDLLLDGPAAANGAGKGANGSGAGARARLNRRGRSMASFGRRDLVPSRSTQGAEGEDRDHPMRRRGRMDGIHEQRPRRDHLDLARVIDRTGPGWG